MQTVLTSLLCRGLNFRWCQTCCYLEIPNRLGVLKAQSHCADSDNRFGSSWSVLSFGLRCHCRAHPCSLSSMKNARKQSTTSRPLDYSCSKTDFHNPTSQLGRHHVVGGFKQLKFFPFLRYLFGIAILVEAFVRHWLRRTFKVSSL